MKIKLFGCFILVLFIVILFGCISKDIIVKKESIGNYKINVKSIASVGTTMIGRESWNMTKRETWAGTGIYGTPPIKSDLFREELIYSGISGNIIRISYREYIGERRLARPSFFQELSYDLGRSDIFLFKTFRIRVFNADNEKIEFMVLQD